MGLSAQRIAAAVRTAETTAAEQVELALQRAAASHDLNIFNSIDLDGARAKAAEVDRQIAGGEQPGLLAGVPFAVKDLIDQAGSPNTCGSSFAPATPSSTAPCVSRLEALGAIPIGRVGLHEFAFGFSSENPWFGPVRNPLDHELSPGGSSGGSAAAVAAGVVPLALGTDTGGSVRVPAALCGIAGLKVTHGRGSNRGVYPLAPGLDTVGPLARTIDDLELAYRALAPHDPMDPISHDQPIPSGTPVPIEGLVLAVPHPWVDTGYEARVERDFTSTLSRLEALGARIEHIEIPEAAPPGLGLASAYYEAAAVHRTRFEADPEAYGADLQIRLRDALAVTGQQYAAALEWRKELRRALERALVGVSALVTPTTAAVTKPIGVEVLELTTGEQHYRSPLSHFTALVNNAGLPALSLPILDTGTPPLSLQLIGKAWSESDLLAIGHTLESAQLNEV